MNIPVTDQIFDVAIIGLGVMGQGLAANFARNGYKVAGFDSHTNGVKDNIGDPASISIKESLAETIRLLSTPRQIFIMVPAGGAVDTVLGELLPLCEKGDIVVDCGNSHFVDTNRRQAFFKKAGISLVGMGVSGGKNGVLYGPSMMPGGDKSAVQIILPKLRKIAAKAGKEKAPCVAYIGKRSAGHFVKMVHNGIEYGEMQLIAEVYDFMTRGLGFSAKQCADVFSRWYESPQGSFLIGITAQVLNHIDAETGKPLVELIVDRAGQKGTGRWTSQSALDLGVDVPTITAGVDARIMSSRKDERIVTARHSPGDLHSMNVDVAKKVDLLGPALFAGRISAFTQGFKLLAAASLEYQYELELASIAKIWRAGCILRSPLLDDLHDILATHDSDNDLLISPLLQKKMAGLVEGARQIAGLALKHAIPMPALFSAISYYDSLHSARLPANLIQAQRDRFGAHGFERIDKKGRFKSGWEPSS